VPLKMSGMIEDTRKLLQDLVSPDLKALQEQVAGLEKIINARFTALESTISSNKDVILANIISLEGKVDSNHASVLNSLNLDKRIEKLEEALSRSAAPAG